jgi:hypothetical protein
MSEYVKNLEAVQQEIIDLLKKKTKLKKKGKRANSPMTRKSNWKESPSCLLCSKAKRNTGKDKWTRKTSQK